MTSERAVPSADDSRAFLGKIVRTVWIEWAKEQSDPKPSWLLSWGEISDADREVDMRIGEALFQRGRMATEMILDSEIRELHSQRDAAQVERDEHIASQALMAKQFKIMQAEKEHGWRKAEKAERRAEIVEDVIGRIVLLADAQDGRDGYVMVYALRAALAGNEES